MNRFLTEKRDALLELPLSPPPAPWKPLTIRAVGGCTEVGFAAESDLLLMLSSQGGGVLDCCTGELVARDRSDKVTEGFNPYQLTAEGFGPLAGQVVNMAGQSGGGLALFTADGWQLSRETLRWPEQTLLLQRLEDWRLPPAEGNIKLLEDSTLLAAGFSPTGRSLVAATTSTVYVWARA